MLDVRYIVLTVTLLALSCGASIAEESGPAGSLTLAQAATDEATEQEEGSLGIVGKATVYVDDAQRNASERFGNFMAQVDGFFSNAGTNEDAVSNQSWARIRLDAIRPGGESAEVKPSLKLRVVLPQTERKFKLLLSTEDDDTEQVGENVGRSSSASRGDDQNASIAIRFIRTARTNGRVDIDLGIRQRESEVQYFSRLNLGYRGELARHWTASVNNSYYYYNKSGFEDKLSFDFRRVLFFNDDLFFRSFTEFNWRKGRKGAIIGQTVGLYTQIDESRSLALEMLAGYHTALNAGVDDRFRGHEIRVRWRHNVWRPWFFYEFWPSVSWPSTNDYERSYGVLLRMEVVVGQR